MRHVREPVSVNRRIRPRRLGAGSIGARRVGRGFGPGVGIRLLRKVGDLVGAGDAVAIVEARREAPDWADEVRRAYSIADQAPTPKPLIIEDSGR